MSYDMIDRFLRNNLDDDDYVEYSLALDQIASPQPPQRKPLTDEQIKGVFFDMGQYAKVDLKAFARAIEAAHGIGDGPIIDEGAKYEELEYCPHGKPEGHTCWSCGNIEQAEMRGEL